MPSRRRSSAENALPARRAGQGASAAVSPARAPDRPVLRAIAGEAPAPARPFPEAAPSPAAAGARTSGALATAPRPDAAPQAQVPSSPAPVPAEAPTDALAERVGVVVIATGARPDAAIRSVAEGVSVVYAASASDAADAAAARALGADVAAPADGPASPGRARNAGYRALKQRRPGLRYVQFLEAGATLEPGWLETAARFMDRRPEVAVLEGRAEAESEEIQTADENMMARADAFEAAGGFRGDLAVNETRDLCIRLRRRGARVWRLDAGMIRPAAGKTQTSFADWWAAARRAGYEYAHGARLHGGRPERLFVREHIRTLTWGAGIPVLAVLAALGAAAFARITNAPASLIAAAAAALAVGAAAYLVRIVALAARRGPGRLAAWRGALAEAFAPFPEFVGAWRFYFPAKPKRVKA